MSLGEAYSACRARINAEVAKEVGKKLLLILENLKTIAIGWRL